MHTHKMTSTLNSFSSNYNNKNINILQNYTAVAANSSSSNTNSGSCKQFKPHKLKAYALDTNKKKETCLNA